MMLYSCLLFSIITNFIATTSTISTTLDHDILTTLTSTKLFNHDETNLDHTNANNNALFTIRLSIKAIIIFTGCITLCIVCTIGVCCAYKLHHRYNEETTKNPMDTIHVINKPHIVYGSSPSAVESNTNLSKPKRRPHTIDFASWQHNYNSHGNHKLSQPQRHAPSVGDITSSQIIKDGLSHLGLSVNISSASSLAPPVLNNHVSGFSGTTASSISVSPSEIPVIGMNNINFEVVRRCTLNDIAINRELPKSPTTTAQLAMDLCMDEIQIDEDGNVSDSEIYIQQPKTPRGPLETVSKPMDRYID